ncbi:MAG: 2-methylaconitate cis-trans isomerase PrpF [Methyloligellaceae bacterium]
MSARRIAIPAVFIRGGTSKGVFFHARDLPAERTARDALFLRVLGSPDPYQRQLDGLGGGISSLSKAVVIAPSSRPDADVDYTFAQVSVGSADVDYSATCGNLSSAVGPFAVDEGLVQVADGEALVRVFNTNTGKLYHARFRVEGGLACESGDFVIPGVATPGAPVALDYLAPGGAATGRLLPTGNVRDRLEVPGEGGFEVSLVDATSAVVFLAAADVGCTACETPDELDARAGLLARLDAIRRHAAVAMGMVSRPEDAPLAAPRIALVAPPAAYAAIDGRRIAAGEQDLAIRIVSMERFHKAVTLTGAMCTGVAAAIEGTLPNRFASGQGPQLRLGTPSGVLPVEARVERGGREQWHARSATVYRTQRRLMQGEVLLPAGTGMRALAAE